MPDEFPRLGFGTYSETNREQWSENVERALSVGYRHVDTAEVYRNEKYVGDGIERASVPREEVFLATKTVHPDEPRPDREDVLDGVSGCLERLGTDYVDLLYVHWPADGYDPETTLEAFNELRESGTVRNVGVSNFAPDQLDRAREILDTPLFANQVEMHPLLPQERLLEYAREHDHWLVAYCPLAQGRVFDVPVLEEIAAKHGVTPAVVSIAWLLSKENVAAIPKTTSVTHMRENFAAAEIELDPEDIERIDAIDERHRIIDREYAPWRR